LQSHGEADSVVVGERPVPQPGPGQVRIKLVAAAFNHVDLYMRDSGVGITHELPLILGVDGAGTVDALGDGVSGWEPGQRVVIYPAEFCGECEYCRRGEQMLCLSCKINGEHIDGTFADYVCIEAHNLFALPDSVDFETAATLPVAYLTAWRMVMTQAAVRPAETVLVHGVGGGVALASMQLARYAGCHVIATTSGAEKTARARELGADQVIDYRSEDVVETVMQATDGRGVDVVVDNVGAQTWPISLRAVRRGGRIVTCGATTGPNPKADLQRVFIRQIQITGSTLGSHEEFRRVILAVADGRIAPVIDHVYSFEQANEALGKLTRAEQFGKLVLNID
jgi:NADPH:quinone reductase-like Zn-dependent oxidoreductase